MSTVDIPELADLIASCLSHHDLTVCIRVNKAWNTAFVTHLWRTVPTPAPLTHPSRCDPLHLAIRSDFLATQRQKEHLQEREYSSSFLTTYGPCIRHLTMFQLHLKVNSAALSESSFSSSQSTAAANVAANIDPCLPSAPEPTEQQLLLHLLKHCPNLQSLNLLQWSGTDEDLDFWRTIARDVIPSLVHLSVSFYDRGPYSQNHYTGPMTVSIPPILIGKCSSKLQTLNISFPTIALKETTAAEADANEAMEDVTRKDALGDDATEEEKEKKDKKEKDELAANEETLVSLKLLSTDMTENSDSSYFKLLLRRCPNLETLHVGTIDQCWAQELAECNKLKELHVSDNTGPSLRLLADALRTSLPNVDALRIDYGDHFHEDFITDTDVASVLSAGRKGWRTLSLPNLETASAEVLVQHTATLESLEVMYTPGLTSAQMFQILSLSPRLHTFITLAEGECVDPRVSHMLAEDFVDLNHTTNTVRPWPCESTLKQFRVKILGIPRPDVIQTYYGHTRGEPEEGNEEENVEVLQETYPGQGRELQAHVYERLSRFTRLKVLGLGHDDRDFGMECNFVETMSGEWVLGDRDYQYDCLEMSLESGLQKLETLKDLKELDVFRMATCVGVEEVQWMTKAWPKLARLSGLNVEGNEVDAETWLGENCPEIQSNPCIFWM
ncbi:hypothetical protein BGZ96_009744 [Linnemannia gamsii]|uniref:F-box domain-containing protein n=1 Tax=Linnemannia gamsii TaxID=64522 RepID=A0ABQ7JW68_9FUNG|nr:hypothetical protein BGZ96_009744 [Linnemannia gamsii]